MKQVGKYLIYLISLVIVIGISVLIVSFFPSTSPVEKLSTAKADWRNAPIFLEARTVKYNELPLKIKEKVDEYTNYEGRIRICDDWSTAYMRACDDYSLDELYFPIVKTNNKIVAYWSYLYSCNRQVCSQEKMDEFFLEISKNRFLTYGKYRNIWIFKKDGLGIKDREKFDGHNVIDIEQNGDIDTIWFFPTEFRPSSIGIKLMHNVTETGSVLDSKFIDL